MVIGKLVIVCLLVIVSWLFELDNVRIDMDKYDLTILGAGPGGYVAALYAAQLGMKVCLIEEDKVGGVCLNCGCIPTKTLLASSKTFSIVRDAGKLGIKVEGARLDFSFVLKRKSEVVEKLKKGIESLLAARKVDVKQGRGVFLNKNTVKVKDENIQSKFIIVATGSVPMDIPCARFNGKSVLSSRDLLEAESLPEEMVIIGGGAIGCEFASIFSEFGCRITIIEMMPNLIPGYDKEISKRLEAIFKKKNIGVMTGVKVESVRAEGKKISVKVSDGKELSCQTLLVSVGRKPNVKNIGLEEIGIEFDEKKGIKVNDGLKTSVDNIFAIGDCIGGYMYAHVASYEGIVACDNIAGRKEAVDYSAVPSCIFTNPDIASSGINEDTARSKGIDIETSKFYFRALGKAHTLDKTDGFIKMVIDKKTKKILGVDIMGEEASELIAEATLAIKSGKTPQDLAKTIHAHPTMSEAILEVAHVAEGTPIHTL